MKQHLPALTDLECRIAHLFYEEARANTPEPRPSHFHTSVGGKEVVFENAVGDRGELCAYRILNPRKETP